jgi:hypothetical protein
MLTGLFANVKAKMKKFSLFSEFFELSCCGRAGGGVGDGHWRAEKRSIGLVKVRPILEFASDVPGLRRENIDKQ